MKRLALALVASAIAAACSSSTPAGPGPIVAGSTSASDAKPSEGVPRNWVAHLAGRNESPNRETRAQGQALFQLNAEGTEITFKLISTNIDNAFMAHIHNAPVGANGPIVQWLFGRVAENGGRHNGILAEGKIPSDLVGSMTLPQLIAHLDSGDAYVNVHTSDGNSGNGNASGPGDFGGGEIRGQVERAGH
jgi:hypothetical protein